jgi:CRISPR/Cas system-associated exonuclease Cas4 (RecB family)
MRTGIDVDPREIVRIVRIINSHWNEEVPLNDLLVELLKKKISSSDYLFILLSKLQDLGLIEGKRGVLFVKERVGEELLSDLERKIISEVSRKRKIFVTPLEVAKFYQCPRRFYLEKVVLSRQFKKEKGKVWDGEVVHLAVQMFINSLMKKSVDELIWEIPKLAMDKYKDKTTITEEAVGDFLLKFYQLINDEEFDLLIPERTLLSIKRGIMGTPDIIARKSSGEFVPIDIKFGRIDRRGVKKEHLLQNVGEALLVEDFLRTRIDMSYLVYFQASSVIKIQLTEEMKKEFISFKRELERVSTKKKIPHMSRLPNARTRVCKGCHVKPACDNIEELVRMGR